MARALLAFLLGFTLMLGIKSTFGRELYPGQYADVDPAVREWFRSQKIPGGQNKGNLCCNEADGTYAEEDIVNGRYWTRWRDQHGVLTPWLPVPPESVLQHGNPNGSPVVWWGYDMGQGKVIIRCYAPGGGV